MTLTKYSLIFSLILALGCGGCSTADHPVLSQLTKPFTVNTTPPAGPHNYQQGWKDGCETGISSTNNATQLLLGTHRFTIDPGLRNDPLYNKAWRYGFNHCGYSMRSVARYQF
jgi:hypothetical protein